MPFFRAMAAANFLIAAVGGRFAQSPNASCVRSVTPPTPGCVSLPMIATNGVKLH